MRRTAGDPALKLIHLGPQPCDISVDRWKKQTSSHEFKVQARRSGIA